MQKEVRWRQRIEDYIFSEQNQQPNDLVMLQNPLLVKDSLFEELNTPQLLVWVVEHPNNQDKQTIQRAAKKIQVKFQMVPTIQDFLNIITKSFVVIICNPIIKKELVESRIWLYDKESNLKKINKIICYPSNDEDKASQKIKTWKTDDREVLQKLIQSLADQEQEQNFRSLFNFNSIRRNVVSSNLLSRCFLGVMNYKNQKASKFILSKLRELIKLISKSNSNFQSEQQKLQTFLTIVEKEKVTENQVIKIYTEQGPVYGFVNNLLRSSPHPCRVFYIEGYLRLLSDTIKKKYIAEKNKENGLTNFTCYRGGFITANEIQELKLSVGDFIQNLSFLSTSKVDDKRLVENFYRNVYFTIYVKIKKGWQNLGPGFAVIQKGQSKFDENQILFNPLTIFKVLQVKVKKLGNNQQNYEVFLLYGEQQRILNEDQSLFTPEQKLKKLLFKNQKIDENLPTTCFGEILVTKNRICEKGAKIYWQKHLQLSEQGYRNKVQKKYDRRYNSYIYTALVYMAQGNMKMAEDWFLEGQKAAIEIYGKESLEYLKVLNDLANFQQTRKQFNEASNKYYAALNILKSLKQITQKQRGHLRIGILNCIILCLSNQRKTQLSIRQYANLLNVQMKNELKQSYKEFQYFGILVNLANTYQNLSSKFNRLKNKKSTDQIKYLLTKSIQYYKHSLKISIVLYGENHHSSAGILLNLGSAYEKMKQYKKALETVWNSFKTIRLLKSCRNQVCPSTFVHLGWLCYIGQRYKSSQFFYRSSIKFYSKLISNHPSISEVRIKYSILLINQNRFDEAILQYKKIAYFIKNENNASIYNESYVKALIEIEKIERIKQRMVKKRTWYENRLRKAQAILSLMININKQASQQSSETSYRLKKRQEIRKKQERADKNKRKRLIKLKKQIYQEQKKQNKILRSYKSMTNKTNYCFF